MSKTLSLNVDEDEEWEPLEEEPSMILKFSLVGKSITKKPWNRRLMMTVFGMVWGVDTGWSLKVLD